MAIVLQRTGKVTTSQAASVTTYYYAGSGAITTTSTIESNRQAIIRTAGTASKMNIMVTSNDRGASTLKFRKNTADGNQVASITASTTGNFEDATNSDALAATDIIDYQLVTGAGGTAFNFNSISHLFDSGTNTSQRLVSHVGSGLGAGDFYPISGTVTGSLESNMQCKIYGNGGIFKNLAVFCSANTRDGDCTVRLRVNGVATAMTATIPASTTGTFEDVANTVSAVANDLVCHIANRGGTVGACTIQYVAVDFETTDRTFLMNCFGSVTPPAATTGFLVTSGGNTASVAVEANAQTLGRSVYTLSNLRVFVAANTINEASIFNLRKNAADATLTVSITGLTAGAFEDVTHTDPIIATDAINFKYVTGATGTSLIIRNSTMLAQASGGSSGSTLLLMGVG